MHEHRGKRDRACKCHRPACAYRRLDALLNILGLLAGPELDDAEISQPVLAEGIFPDYGFDLLQVLAHRQDDPAFPRYLSPRDEEVAGRIILVQEADVRPHVCVDVLEAGLVDELDDEHGREPRSRTPRGSSAFVTHGATFLEPVRERAAGRG